jgi:hypothetical protein
MLGKMKHIPLSVTVLEIIKQKTFYAVSPRNSRMPVALYLITTTYSAVSILRMPTVPGSSSVQADALKSFAS